MRRSDHDQESQKFSGKGIGETGKRGGGFWAIRRNVSAVSEVLLKAASKV